jgi:hypothetical protein
MVSDYSCPSVIPTDSFLAAKILKSEEQQRITELKLAMAWNKFDRIQRNILTDKTIFQWAVCILISICFI